VEIKEFSQAKEASKYKIKTLLVCCVDIRCIIHFEFVCEETTVSYTVYVQMLIAVRHKRELWRDGYAPALALL
jgi:hypothetical protein